MRVVVVVVGGGGGGGGVVGGSSLLIIGLKKLLVSVIQQCSQLKFSAGWDPLRFIKIGCPLTRFLFRVGSLPFIYCTYLYNGICQGEISKYICRILLIGSFLLQYVGMLSMPQVFEQSLFLFHTKKLGTVFVMNRKCCLSSCHFLFSSF